ncbi:hypothetical protein MES4922_300164 [Mesorhizobium ventifaucium]|uniref:Uncharacterized protein n=1 Tax=Mesorhizobium ventifaucium TaxID=666020 RepID=A0ABM9E1P8_9HYPH|nr:hypothetical protein MES4922_300164 [Mesorhizobium ventifaucium]
MLVPADQFKKQGSRPLATASLIEFEPNLRNAALNILNGASAPGHAALSRNATRFNAPRDSPPFARLIFTQPPLSSTPA